MQRFKTWLTRRLNADKNRSEARQWQSNIRPAVPTSQKKREAVESITYDADVGGRIEDGGPGKNVLIRNQYVREDTGTHEILKIYAASNLDQDDEDRHDPYNSGRFDRSKSWASYRSRK